MTIGAKINTEVTFLAKFFVYLDMTFHNTSPKQFRPSCFQNPVADTLQGAVRDSSANQFQILKLGSH